VCLGIDVATAAAATDQQARKGGRGVQGPGGGEISEIREGRTQRRDFEFFRKGGELTLAEVTWKVGPACLCLLLPDCPANLIYLMYLLYEIDKRFNLFLRVLI
jgi:hypothetical protein